VQSFGTIERLARLGQHLDTTGILDLILFHDAIP
jgi:hypothetical protein